jgi:RES domain-containing protein
LRFQGTCCRVHDPKWAFSPVSGAGAAIRGARFNPKGVEALYLALTLEGAFLEVNQGLAMKFVPGTLCSYETDCADLADLRVDEGRKALRVDLKDMACAWMDFLARGEDPPSWGIARRLIRDGYAGILVPSFAIGATLDRANLVLWQWGETAPYKAVVYDPQQQLPKDQASWI